MLKFVSFIVCFIVTNVAFGQRQSNHIVVSGKILSYTYDDTKSVFKKDKQIEIEGGLSEAAIQVTNAKKKTVLRAESDEGGNFIFALPLDEVYLVTYSKPGYGTSAFELDMTSISNEIKDWGLILQNLDLILNNFESDKAQDNGESFGRVVFNSTTEAFQFTATQFSQKKRLFNKDEDNTSINLMRRSIEKNSGVNHLASKVIPELQAEERHRSGNRLETSSVVINDTIPQYQLTKTKLMLATYSDLDFRSPKFSAADLVAFENEIAQSRAQLEHDKRTASTEADFVNIATRERLLSAAEQQLTNARLFIQSQADTIKAQESFIFSLVGLVILMLGFAIFIYLAYRSKRKNLNLLAEKNRKIAESLRYALRIQQSVLLRPEQIKSIIPNTFVFHQPLDAVSGDFYWFSKIDDVIVMAAVDCTGHGVPGAFMSLIGNTLMNQIVNEKQLLQPGLILKELHEGIVRSLNQEQDDEAAQDGMDISICAYDTKQGKLTFSGANNSVYVLKNNEIITLQANALPVGGFVRKNKKIDFTEHEMAVSKGDRIYLFSDGYMDQFGGQKDEKFNVSRFKKLILDQKSMEMKQQLSVFKDTFESWKLSKNQTDDVLVIGVEI